MENINLSAEDRFAQEINEALRANLYWGVTESLEETTARVRENLNQQAKHKEALTENAAANPYHQEKWRPLDVFLALRAESKPSLGQLKLWARDLNPEVRSAVAQYEALPYEILRDLARDRDRGVRGVAASFLESRFGVKSA